MPTSSRTISWAGAPELAALDEWAQSQDVVLLVKAIGGVGKSALTWEWVRRQSEARRRIMPG